MKRSLFMQRSSTARRPTRAEVKLAVLEQNLVALRKYAGGTKVMAVVKANGYGHGLVAASQAFERAGADYLGVAFIEEALELREGGVTLPILVFGGLQEDQLSLYIKNGIDITAPSVGKLEQINSAAVQFGQRARVHLKIDTGLERVGVHHYSSETLFEAALRSTSVDVIGVFSHFASVEADDLTLARTQLDRYLKAIQWFEKRSPAPFIRHIANSAAVLAFPESHLDMVRPGLALYGVYPDPEFKQFVSIEPALSLKSRVVYFKVVRKGSGVSYGHRWIAERDTRIATIPIGYGDGYPRQLSNRAAVLVRGRRCPIRGSVCMDQFMVDLGPDGEGYNGDEAVLIGTQGEERISVEELAHSIDTTPHEILVLLNERVPRVYM